MPIQFDTTNKRIILDSSSVTAEEIWKEIPGYSGRYFVSNFGKIKSTISFDSIGRPRNPKIMKKVIEKRRGIGIREKIMLVDDCGNKKVFKVHYLVMLSFWGETPKGQGIRHIDGNGLNNHISNLSFGTHLENMDDMVNHGKSRRGEKNNKCVLTEKIVKYIKSLDFSKRGSQRVFCKKHNINPSTLNAILTGRIWGWL